jgi:membrane protease YdiL (CAAX protease family)
MSNPELQKTLLIAFGALAISLTARGREGGAFSTLLFLWVAMEGVSGRYDWKSMGFRLDNTWKELIRNVWLIGFVGIVTQLIFWLITKFLYIPLREQIMGRITTMRTLIPSLAVLLVFIGYQTLAEEIALRGFIQSRLAPHWWTSVAILVGALSFAGFHWQAHANLPATLMDFMFVALDGVIYGGIFALSRNIFVAWFAHLLADFTSLGLLMAN